LTIWQLFQQRVPAPKDEACDIELLLPIYESHCRRWSLCSLDGFQSNWYTFV